MILGCRPHSVPGGGTITLDDPRCHTWIENTVDAVLPGIGLVGQDLLFILGFLLIFILVPWLFFAAARLTFRLTSNAFSTVLGGDTRACAIERAEVAEREVRRLSERISELLEERTLLNGVVAKSSASNKGDTSRFHKLRNLIVHELHPDGQANLSQIERLIRAELFKALWPAIQRIESREGD